MVADVGAREGVTSASRVWNVTHVSLYTILSEMYTPVSTVRTFHTQTMYFFFIYLNACDFGVFELQKKK